MIIGAKRAVLHKAPPAYSWDFPASPKNPFLSNQQLRDDFMDAKSPSSQVAGFLNKHLPEKASFFFHQRGLLNIDFWAISSRK